MAQAFGAMDFISWRGGLGKVITALFCLCVAWRRLILVSVPSVAN
jgi:hypothetical protein